MRFTIAAAATAAMAIGASAQSGNARPTGGANAGAVGAGAGNAQATAYDTVVVNAYVTTCPGNVALTSFTYNGQGYTASANQVVTVTNCPCTVTAPAGSIPSGALTATAPAQPAVTAPATGANNGGSGSGAAPPAVAAGGNGTTGTTPEPFTGAASKLSGAGLAAVFAIAAYAL